MNGEIAPLRWSALSDTTRRYLLVLVFFALGEIPETFLLLRGHEIGMSVVELPLMWAHVCVVKAAVSHQAGGHTDRVGRRPSHSRGLDGVRRDAVRACVRAAAARALWVWSQALGFYFGLTEGAERALVRDLAAPAERGTAFGWFHWLVEARRHSRRPALLGGLWNAFTA